MSDTQFEIPQSMRDVAEQNMKQAHAAYEQLTEFMTKTMGAWMGAMPSNPMATAFKDVQERTMDFAKDNAESAFSFAGKICNAQTSQEILQLQTQFAQERMQAFAAHTQQLCSMMGDAFQKLKRN
jgi:hypothetical protein